MSVSLLVCYFLTKIRQIRGYLQFWMIYLSEFFQTFLGHWFNSFYSAWLSLHLTFQFLFAGLNFETSDPVTFWFSGCQLLGPLVLFFMMMLSEVCGTKAAIWLIYEVAKTLTSSVSLSRDKLSLVHENRSPLMMFNCLK